MRVNDEILNEPGDAVLREVAEYARGPAHVRKPWFRRAVNLAYTRGRQAGVAAERARLMRMAGPPRSPLLDRRRPGSLPPALAVDQAWRGCTITGPGFLYARTELGAAHPGVAARGGRFTDPWPSGWSPISGGAALALALDKSNPGRWKVAPYGDLPGTHRFLSRLLEELPSPRVALGWESLACDERVIAAGLSRLRGDAVAYEMPRDGMTVYRAEQT